MTRPSWSSIWMDLAFLVAKRSTCGRLQVGCVIVSDDNTEVLALGYNGGAKGDRNECLSSEPGQCGHLHAEVNALIKCGQRRGVRKRMYVTDSPCYICCVAIINAGIRDLVYRNEYRDLSGIDLLRRRGVTVMRDSSSLKSES